MRVKLLFDGDVLQSHRDHFLRLHLVSHFLLLDGHVVDDVLHLVVVRAHALHRHLYLLLHVFDVTLLVRNVFHTPHRRKRRERGCLGWDWLLDLLDLGNLLDLVDLSRCVDLLDLSRGVDLGAADELGSLDQSRVLRLEQGGVRVKGGQWLLLRQVKKCCIWEFLVGRGRGYPPNDGVMWNFSLIAIGTIADILNGGGHGG